MSQNPNGTRDLNYDEQKATNGGSILGGDDNRLNIKTQGYISTSSTDEDGDTETNNIEFGSGSLLHNESE